LNTNETASITSGPIFFERNRVFRVYKGGKLFHDFFGDEETDGNFPEE
jgi:mannose-6-phosphate isomerase